MPPGETAAETRDSAGYRLKRMFSSYSCPSIGGFRIQDQSRATAQLSLFLSIVVSLVNRIPSNIGRLNMKILAVDDDRIVLNLLDGLLKSADFGEVQTCESAERALELIADAQTPFTCFLLDIQMPGMDGIELCEKIREFPKHRDTPILMLTSMSEKTYIDRAFSAGASDYLTKPLDATEIVVRLGIARQLMKERKSLAESTDVIASLIDVLDRTTQHDLEEAIDLGKMEGLLRYPAFENYLYQSGRAALFRSTIFAVKIRNVEDIHRNLPPLEFKAFLQTAASTILDRLKGHDVFITYRGDGEFVGVIPRRGQAILKALDDEIVIAIEESEGKHTAKLPATATLVFGPGASILMPTRGELSKAIWNAVQRVRTRTAPVAQQNQARQGTRDFPAGISRLRQESDDFKEDLRAEFTQLLRDSLQSELGEHRKPSRRRQKKAPASVSKKRQAKASRGDDRKRPGSFSSVNSGKKLHRVKLRAGERIEAYGDENEKLPVSQRVLKVLGYSNG